MREKMRVVNIVCALTVVVGTGCLSQLWGQTHSIDTTSSKLIVHISKAGLFSAFEDNHEIEAPITEGFVDEAARRVKFVIESPRMTVLDPQLSPEKRGEVQQRMLGPDVLDAAHFPQIEFQSTSVEEAGPGRLLVRGRLSLHGVVRPIAVNVRSEKGRYVGTSTLKQQEFGISPVSVAGGTVKVKDELRIEFNVTTSPPTAAVRMR
jgi:hypothetical protein